MDIINQVQKVDAAILGKFTAFCHWFQKLTGKTNFFLASCLTPFVAICLVQTPIHIHRLTLKKKGGILDWGGTYLVDLGCVALLSYLFYMAWLCVQEDRKNESVAEKTEKFSLWVINRTSLRVVVLMLASLSIGAIIGHYQNQENTLENILENLTHPLLLIFLYLAAVNPLPPAKSKIRKWLESLGKQDNSKERLVEN